MDARVNLHESGRIYTYIPLLENIQKYLLGTMNVMNMDVYKLQTIVKKYSVNI